MPDGAPVEGVPDWLAHILLPWFVDTYLGDLESNFAPLALDDIALSLKANLGSQSMRGRLDALRELAWLDRDFLLRILDWGLQFDRGGAAKRLGDLLETAGSAWAIAPDGHGLSRRVLTEANTAAEQVVAAGGDAGKLIAQAWRLIYGPDPNPTAGYDKAVRAVEAIAKPAIIPNDANGTLGRVIGIMKSRPQGKFGTVFKNPREMDPLDSVVGLMQLVWNNNYARHAGNPDVPIDATQAEAEAVLHAAVTLVQWFQRQYVGMEPLPTVTP
jgi:hypothetical protein